MKNGKRKVIAQIAGPGLVLAALLAMVLSNACIGRAQAGTASATPAVTPTQAAAASPATPAHEPSAKGQHEGIKVHGHWTIEVRNPDGKLVSHTEFENALVQPGGVLNLNFLLTGGAVPGGYEIKLGSDAQGFNGPCAVINTSITSCVLVGSFISPVPAAFGDETSGCGGTDFSNQITPVGPCFPLTIALNGGSSGPITFSGTAVANTATPITDVFLSPIICYSSNFFFPGTAATSPNSCAQGSPHETAFTALTHATLPTPVAISAAGQLISVNVQLSFQ